MSDRIGIMQQGRLQQIGMVHEVYERPKNVFVARFLGLPNIIRRGALAHTPLFPANIRHITIHPERIKFLDKPISTVANIVEGVIKERLYMGAHTDYVIAVPDLPDLLVSDSNPNHRFRESGSMVRLTIFPSDIIPLEG